MPPADEKEKKMTTGPWGEKGGSLETNSGEGFQIVEPLEKANSQWKKR